MRKKARLVAQRYSQIEGTDFEKTFAHVSWLESIRILLACMFLEDETFPNGC